MSPIVRKESSKKFSLTSDDTPKEKTTNKTWQIIFHTSNIQKDRNILVKFSLIANNDDDDEKEIYQINIKQSSTDKKYSFTVKDIGKPEQIRLKIYTTDDDDDNEDIKWYLDHVRNISKNIQ